VLLCLTDIAVLMLSRKLQLVNTTFLALLTMELWLVSHSRCQNLLVSHAITLQPILHTSTGEAVRTDLLLCDRWQTPAQACTCC